MMPFGRSEAGLGSISAYRASVVQRVRTLSRVQHVVSTIYCWCSHSGGAGGDVGARQRESFAEQPRDNRVPNGCGDAIGGWFRVGAPQPAHEPYRHTGPLPRSNGIAVAGRVFPVL
jgi:hypothetical protein